MTLEAKKYAWIAVTLHTLLILFIAAAFWHGYQNHPADPEVYECWLVPASIDWLAVAVGRLVDIISRGRIDAMLNGRVALITLWSGSFFIIFGGLQWYAVVGFVANRFERRNSD